MSARAASDSKRKAVTALRQDEILEAARHVFGLRGFNPACVDEIARRAGVAKGTVYLYYPSKQALYRAALREGLRRMVEQLREAVGAAASTRARLRAYVASKLAFAEGHHDFLRMYSAASEAGGVPLHLQKDFRGFYEAQLELLEQALGEGRDAPAARMAAVAVFDLTGGLIKRRLFGRTREETERDMEAVLELLSRALEAR